MIKALSNISPRAFMIFNFISFQSAWFVAVNLQNTGLVILIAILSLHFIISEQRQRDCITMVLIVLAGCLVDQIATYAGLFSFKELPIWLLLLWANFGLTFHYSLSWLNSCSIFIQAILGGISGSLSYIAAYKLGAVEFPLNISLTIFYLVVIWFVTLPVYVFIARIIQGKYYATKPRELF